MLKTVNGREYMTGTSEGSLYPVVLSHENGLKMGARLQLQSTPNPDAIIMSVYARIERYVDGELVTPTLQELFDAFPNLQMRLASVTHISGFLFQGILQIKPGVGVKKKARAFGEVFRDGMKSFAKEKNLTTISDDDLCLLGQDAYTTQILNAPDDTKIEQQLDDGVKFDVLNMLGKPGASDPKK